MTDLRSDDNELSRYLERVAALLLATDREPIHRIARHLFGRYQIGATLITCGNGGSAATASHFVCDLTKATRHEQRVPVRALCLNDNVAGLTAWANDTTYALSLAEQLRSLGKPGDVLIAISGSGNSANVLNAVVYAKAHGMFVVALTGSGGGALAPMANVAVIVPSDELPAIEDCHMAICHALTNELKGSVERG